MVEALALSSWQVTALVRGDTEPFEQAEAITIAVGDVTDPALTDALRADLGEEPLDLVVNNAGIGAKGKALATVSIEEAAAAAVDVHVFGALRVTQAALPHLCEATNRSW